MTAPESSLPRRVRGINLDDGTFITTDEIEALRRGPKTCEACGKPANYKLWLAPQKFATVCEGSPACEEKLRPREAEADRPTQLRIEIEAIRELRDALHEMLESGTGGAPSRLERARKAYEAVPIGQVLRRENPPLFADDSHSIPKGTLEKEVFNEVQAALLNSQCSPQMAVRISLQAVAQFATAEGNLPDRDDESYDGKHAWTELCVEAWGCYPKAP